MARSTPLPAQDLQRLSSARWLVPILALMSAGNGARFGILVRALQVSRSVLSRHLDLLEDFGWIARNPGHGHPLRPEYMLTASGRPIGAWCEKVMGQKERFDLGKHDFGRWSLSLLFELYDNRSRFSMLEEKLAPITPRALSLGLKQLMFLQLAEKSRDPRPLYGLTRQGTQLVQILTGSTVVEQAAGPI